MLLLESSKHILQAKNLCTSVLLSKKKKTAPLCTFVLLSKKTKLMSTIEHIKQIIEFLNANADYAVLRNFEGLPEKNKSRDIDIIITRNSYKKIKRSLVELIDRSGW